MRSGQEIVRTFEPFRGEQAEKAEAHDRLFRFSRRRDNGLLGPRLGDWCRRRRRRLREQGQRGTKWIAGEGASPKIIPER